MTMITKQQRKQILTRVVAGKPAAQHDITKMSNGANKIFSLLSRGISKQEHLIEEARKPKKEAKRKYTRRKKVEEPKVEIEAEVERGITISTASAETVVGKVETAE